MVKIIKTLILLLVLNSSLSALENNENHTLFIQRAGHNFEIPFIINGEVDKEGYYKLCMIACDLKSRRVAYMDPNLFYILVKTQKFLYERYGIVQPIVITSGYRTAGTNSSIEGAAKRSQHLSGKALDIQIPGVDTKTLAYVMRYFGARGIGIYNRHLHIDLGEIRAWRGISH